VGTAIISGLFGLLGGGVASLIAPWSQWGVEKRRGDRQHRRDLVREWRNGLAQLESGQDAPGTEWYESLRPHLTDDEIRQVEPVRHPRVVTISIDAPIVARDAATNALAGAVARTEQGWKL
jgi:hypothetical protein